MAGPAAGPRLGGCPQCLEDGEIAEDAANGQMVCVVCGLVIESSILSFAPPPPSAQATSTSSLSVQNRIDSETVIGSLYAERRFGSRAASDRTPGHRAPDSMAAPGSGEAGRSAGVRTLRADPLAACRKIEEWAHSLGLPVEQSESAQFLLVNLLEDPPKDQAGRQAVGPPGRSSTWAGVRPRALLAAACLHVMCLKVGRAITHEELATIARVPVKRLRQMATRVRLYFLREQQAPVAMGPSPGGPPSPAVQAPPGTSSLLHGSVPEAPAYLERIVARLEDDFFVHHLPASHMAILQGETFFPPPSVPSQTPSSRAPRPPVLERNPRILRAGLMRRAQSFAGLLRAAFDADATAAGRLPMEPGQSADWTRPSLGAASGRQPQFLANRGLAIASLILALLPLGPDPPDPTTPFALAQSWPLVCRQATGCLAAASSLVSRELEISYGPLGIDFPCDPPGPGQSAEAVAGPSANTPRDASVGLAGIPTTYSSATLARLARRGAALLLRLAATHMPYLFPDLSHRASIESHPRPREVDALLPLVAPLLADLARMVYLLGPCLSDPGTIAHGPASSPDPMPSARGYDLEDDQRLDREAEQYIRPAAEARLVRELNESLGFWDASPP
ncbi:hypothetical protein H696_02519 [Fonticula alba]|uniref:General transcription factor TFIIB n=1 Tax=Fonticula alba TaxID=691883 RepID=A0A058ZAY1_FONAL|nr:hypothetical protein H696_02519 [Fonticula alba]KCV71580.1 hypothetical protein H696_02519 [Fonticula alba]|eukprot:XP_009494703.1 hypothetical protein H696_02519 [Fonticula alba]